MTPYQEESNADPATEPWQEKPPFPVVPEHNFAAQRVTFYALLIAAVMLPCVYVAVTAWNDYRAREAAASEARLPATRASSRNTQSRSSISMSC